MYFILSAFLSLLFTTAHGRIPNTRVRGNIYIDSSCSAHLQDLYRSIGYAKALSRAASFEVQDAVEFETIDGSETMYSRFFGSDANDRRIVYNVYYNIWETLDGLRDVLVEFTCLSTLKCQYDYNAYSERTGNHDRINICPSVFVTDEPVIPDRCSYFLDNSIGSIILWQMLLLPSIVHVELLDGLADYETSMMIAEGRVYDEGGWELLKPSQVAANYVYMAQTAYKWKFVRSNRCKNWKNQRGLWVKTNPLGVQTTYATSVDPPPIFSIGDRDELRRKLLKTGRIDPMAGG